MSARIRERVGTERAAPRPRAPVDAYFVALIKARLPAARERLKVVKSGLVEDSEPPILPKSGEVERVVSAIEAALDRLEELAGRYGSVVPLSFPRPAPSEARRAAVELASLLEDIADFAEETGDPAFARVAARLRALAERLPA